MGQICGATFGAVFGSISGSNLLPFFGLFTNTSVAILYWFGFPFLPFSNSINLSRLFYESIFIIDLRHPH